jgi:AAA family ATP:ADP antiporter
MHTVSGKNLHGYEAAYKVEKERAKTGKSHTGVFSGLLMFFRYPYLMGIFCMVFFYEVINTVLSYERITVAQANGGSMAQVSGFLYQIIFWTHLVGFTISLIGTKTLLRKLGEKRCLLLVPVTTGLMLFYYLMYPSHWSMLFVFVVIRAINYGFSYPVRESLYIPTVKDIKFKSKSWIDSFGTKFAKSSGSTFNIIVDFLGNGFIIPAYSGFFGVIIGVWIFAALLLGRRFEWAVAHDEVIGADS